MTQVTNKGNNLYYIEGFGNYQANKELTVPEINSLVQNLEIQDYCKNNMILN